MWQDWTNGVLGLAIIGIAFLGLSGSTLVWTLAVVGALVAVVGFWGAGVTTTTGSTSTSRTTSSA